MTDWPNVVALLITYKRTALAVRTVEGVKKYLIYPAEKLSWHVSDDGSPPEHIVDVLSAIEPAFVTISNATRRGVGASMNLGMHEALERADFILWLEDDWELTQTFDLRPCVRALQEWGDVGMVRLGYISPGVRGDLIAGAGRLWWKLEKGPTYVFTGHASLRHKRFCEAYGDYQEGVSPGEDELYMCGTFNGRPGPTVVIPAFTGEWGPFGHIGGESLNNVRPG